MLLNTDPVLGKIQKHIEVLGIRSKIPDQKLDFESDYKESHLLEKDGVGSAGSLELVGSPIDYIHLVKKQELAKCDFAVGGHVGMGIHIHSWWKIRFFLSFPESIKLGPFDMGTITTVRKGVFHSQVESFLWSGYQKLTTLPPGLVRDNVADALYSNQTLRQLMTKCLLKERTITVSRYSPKHHEPNTKQTNSKVVIESTWRLQKDLLMDEDTLYMYEKIAEIIKFTVDNLKYHLR
jgi:hypothetical protein